MGVDGGGVGSGGCYFGFPPWIVKCLFLEGLGPDAGSARQAL